MQCKLKFVFFQVRVPVAVNRPVTVKDIKPLHYEEIEQFKDKRIPPIEDLKSLHDDIIRHSDESHPPIEGIKSFSFGQNTEPNIKDLKPLIYEKIVQFKNKPIPLVEDIKSFDDEITLLSDESLPPIADTKSLNFEKIIEPNNDRVNIEDIKPLIYDEIVSSKEAHNILDELDTEQEPVYENHLSDVN